jgi:hypothetical protein
MLFKEIIAVYTENHTKHKKVQTFRLSSRWDRPLGFKGFRNVVWTGADTKWIQIIYVVKISAFLIAAFINYHEINECIIRIRKCNISHHHISLLVLQMVVFKAFAPSELHVAIYRNFLYFTTVRIRRALITVPARSRAWVFVTWILGSWVRILHGHLSACFCGVLSCLATGRPLVRGVMPNEKAASKPHLHETA